MRVQHLHVMSQVSLCPLCCFGRVLAKSFPLLISVILSNSSDWRVLLVLHVVIACDPQTQQHLHKLSTCTPHFLRSILGQSSSELSVLILNLSDILFLPVSWVLRWHPVSLLLSGFLRLVFVNKRRELRFLEFDLSPNNRYFFLSLPLLASWVFGLGVFSLQH